MAQIPCPFKTKKNGCSGCDPGTLVWQFVNAHKGGINVLVCASQSSTYEPPRGRVLRGARGVYRGAV